MARFQNVSGEELLLFARAGQAESFPVPPDGVVDVPGAVTAQTDDAVVIGDGDDARAWPAGLWQLLDDGDAADVADGVGATPDPDTAADVEDAANALAAANVAESTGTAADQAARAQANSPGARPADDATAAPEDRGTGTASTDAAPDAGTQNTVQTGE